MICIFALMLCFTEMEDDEKLERMMLSISPSKLQGQLSKKTSHRHRCMCAHRRTHTHTHNIYCGCYIHLFLKVHPYECEFRVLLLKSLMLSQFSLNKQQLMIFIIPSFHTNLWFAFFS